MVFIGAKDISKTMTLRDGVSGTLSKISAGTVRYKKNMQDLKKQGNDTWASMRTGIGILAGVAAGYMSISSAVSFLQDSANAARESIDAETKLGAVLKNVKGVTDLQIQSLKSYATELQNVGVVEGDVLTSGIQQIGTFQLQAQSIKTLMPGLADLLAQQKGLGATQQDAVTIGNLLGKSMKGQVGALSRVGITFTAAQEKVLKFGNEQQKAATLAQVLQDNVGGVNKALAETDMGKIQQANNAWGDMKENIGGVVLQIQAGFANAFMNRLPQIQTGIQGVTDRVTAWADNGGIDDLINGVNSVWDGINSVWSVAVDTYNFFNNNWRFISPILYGISAGFVAYKISAISAATWTAIFGNTATFAAIKTAFMGTASLVAAGEIGIMTAAQRLLNGAMAANPIGVIITLLGLLVLAGTYVVNNWETVKLAGMKTWNFLVGAVQWGVNAYTTYANTMLKVFLFAWDSIKFAGVVIWNELVAAAEKGVGKLIAPINAVRSLLGKEEFTVNFSQAKFEAVKPSWNADLNVIPKVDFSGAKFSDDSVMAQMQKSKQEQDSKRAKNEEKLVEALEKNTKVTGDNTTATNLNTEKLRDNLSPTDLADSLLSRIERHVYAT